MPTEDNIQNIEIPMSSPNDLAYAFEKAYENCRFEGAANIVLKKVHRTWRGDFTAHFEVSQ